MSGGSERVRSETLEKILHEPENLTAVARELERIGNRLHGRIDSNPENVERGLVQLVLTVVELLRQLMERQAIRRMESGSLTDEEIERLGQTFMLLARRMEELREHFGFSEDDLNLDLGPLGTLL
jgi:Gas vesicle protein K